MIYNSTFFPAIIAWLTVLAFSGCTTKMDTSLIVQPTSQFSIVSAHTASRTSPIASICYGEDGTLYSLLQHSGHITALNADGEIVRSFPRPDSLSGARKFVGTSIGFGGDHLFVVDARSHQVQKWSPEGTLQGVTEMQFLFSPGDTAISPKGEIIHSTEGFSTDALIAVLDETGSLKQTFGRVLSAGSLGRTRSVRDSLAREKMPQFLDDSVLVAAAEGGLVYALHRTRPILQCYQNGVLRFERTLDFPELPKIRQTKKIRNQLLQVPDAYIPFSYWSDIAVAEDGSIYLLLANQSRHTLYRLDKDGLSPRRIRGSAARGHLLALHKSRIAVVDAIDRTALIYELPAG